MSFAFVSSTHETLYRSGYGQHRLRLVIAYTYDPASGMSPVCEEGCRAGAWRGVVLSVLTPRSEGALYCEHVYAPHSLSIYLRLLTHTPRSSPFPHAGGDGYLYTER